MLRGISIMVYIATMSQTTGLDQWKSDECCNLDDMIHKKADSLVTDKYIGIMCFHL